MQVLSFSLVGRKVSLNEAIVKRMMVQSFMLLAIFLLLTTRLDHLPLIDLSHLLLVTMFCLHCK